MTSSDDVAAELRRLRDEAARQQQVRDRMVTPGQLAYYRRLRELRAEGYTHHRIAGMLGVTRSRVSQTLQQADQMFGDLPPSTS